MPADLSHVREFNWEVAYALRDHLTATFGFVVVHKDTATSVAVRMGAMVMARFLGPAPAELLERAYQRLDTTSITLPGAFGGKSLVLLSGAAQEAPVVYARTITHEGVHDTQNDTNGHATNSFYYLAQAGLRAKNEADAAAADMWTGYLFTGVLPTYEEAVRELHSDLYRLGPGEEPTADGIMRSHMDAMEQGIAPNIRVARVVTEWAIASCPQLIKVQRVIDALPRPAPQ